MKGLACVGLAAVAGAFVLVPPTSASEHFIGEIRRFCDQEWGTDFRMVEYCRNRQIEAFLKVQQMHDGPAQHEPHQTMLGQCLADWRAGDGYDWRMVAYCYDRQEQAYRRLQQN